MPVNSSLTTKLFAGQRYFRFTSPSFLTANPALHVKVVDGQGAKRNPYGSRYSPKIAETVYLTEDVETCIAEKMFYFHKETVEAIDGMHPLKGLLLPPFNKTFVMWEVEFKNDVDDVADITKSYSSFSVFPFLTLSPSQDYEHLKDRRAHIQAAGYNGLRAPSARSTMGGHMVVMFDDQSGNVQTIKPYEIEFRLLCVGGGPFTDHTKDMLDFTAGEIRVVGSGPLPGYSPSWQKFNFNR
jgi:hypothetical protein